MRNKKTLLVFVVSSFIVLGFYAGTFSVSGQEGEEINPRKLFEYHCSTCHGVDGKGTKRGHELKAPNLDDAKWQSSKKDEEIVNSITNGKNKMPRWSDKLKPEEIQALASYVRKLSPKKRE